MAHTPTVDPDQLVEVDARGLTGMDEAALVDAIRELEEAKARACAAQARLTRALAARVRARHAEQGVRAALRGRDLPGLVGYARRESPARAARYVGLAHTLIELPHVEAAMSAGALSEWRAMLIARETACLDPADRAAADVELAAPDPAAPEQQGRYRFEGWGDRRLVAETRALVAALDPAAVVDRRARAEADRHLSLRPAPDTMARLSVLLPAVQGVAAYAALARAADTARATGDPRTRGQAMVDTLVTRLTGQTTPKAVPITVNLTVSDHTLLAGGPEPAWLHGHGPLTADHARHLVPAALTDPDPDPDSDPDSRARVALRRLYTRPDTGALVTMDTHTRTFPAALARLLDLRDRTCRTPWCDAPIRHHDHITSHADGGPTTAHNGQGLCEQCNHTKQAPDWRARPLHRPGAPHTVHTTLPTGHTTTSTAPRAPTPLREVPLTASWRPDLIFPSVGFQVGYAA